MLMKIVISASMSTFHLRELFIPSNLNYQDYRPTSLI